jgi:hypothetical protein
VPPLLLLIGLLAGTPEARCGAERQAIKTLTDADARAVRLEPRRTTVEELVALPAPGYREDRPRDRVERTVYEVTAEVVGFKLEPGDGDYHVVIAGPTGATMIAELPNPDCASTSPAAKQLAEARTSFVEQFGRPMRGVYRQLRTPIRARLVGVAFFDLRHRQTGVAPNGIELHPLLRIERLDRATQKSANGSGSTVP